MSNEIIKKPSDIINSMASQWALVLPSVCSKERFTRVALSCVNKNQALSEALKTDNGKTSLMSAFMTCAELGIEPDGRRAHLIPYRDNKNGGYTVQLIIDYKGLVELAMRSGKISNIHADKICQNDKFEYNRGVVEKHVPDFSASRGSVYAYYCHVMFKDGSQKSEVMTKDEVDAIRKRSKASGSGPWVTDYDEMAKKTVFKRCSKWLPLSPEVQDAIQKDDEEYVSEPINITPTTSRFESGILDKTPVSETMQDAEVVHDVKTSEITKETIVQMLKEANAPVSFAEIEAYMRQNENLPYTVNLENNQLKMNMVYNGLNSIVNKTLTWLENQKK